jgi:hypothetical protein
VASDPGANAGEHPQAGGRGDEVKKHDLWAIVIEEQNEI